MSATAPTSNPPATTQQVPPPQASKRGKGGRKNDGAKKGGHTKVAAQFREKMDENEEKRTELDQGIEKRERITKALNDVRMGYAMQAFYDSSDGERGPTLLYYQDNGRATTQKGIDMFWKSVGEHNGFQRSNPEFAMSILVSSKCLNVDKLQSAADIVGNERWVEWTTSEEVLKECNARLVNGAHRTGVIRSHVAKDEIALLEKVTKKRDEAKNDAAFQALTVERNKAAEAAREASKFICCYYDLDKIDGHPLRELLLFALANNTSVFQIEDKPDNTLAMMAKFTRGKSASEARDFISQTEGMMAKNVSSKVKALTNDIGFLRALGAFTYFKCFSSTLPINITNLYNNRGFALWWWKKAMAEWGPAVQYLASARDLAFDAGTTEEAAQKDWLGFDPTTSAVDPHLFDREFFDIFETVYQKVLLEFRLSYGKANQSDYEHVDLSQPLVHEAKDPRDTASTSQAAEPNVKDRRWATGLDLYNKKVIVGVKGWVKRHMSRYKDEPECMESQALSQVVRKLELCFLSPSACDSETPHQFATPFLSFGFLLDIGRELHDSYDAAKEVLSWFEPLADLVLNKQIQSLDEKPCTIMDIFQLTIQGVCLGANVDHASYANAHYDRNNIKCIDKALWRVRDP
ncbi:hypothetical protein NP233_g12976 [Leucocoprinus birnbaumii]|uniref:Uncharacterized protein n=1 Tax=Leucocoprinus birnbaumii TaxID=56174 RepID=A0AAD5VDX4_9AGAR|nr:hypothetical protein NP233_g12976 [Leucocoprinus birnbaumii]